MRLHKLLAHRGVASRRASERLIAEGRVTVNGRQVTEPGTLASPEDEIKVDGRIVTASEEPVYIMLNKPRGILSTARDERERETVVGMLGTTQRLYPVGRLDKDSEGLILLTNDGELANRLTHPGYGVHKTYKVEVSGHFDDAQLTSLRNGVRLEDGISRPRQATILSRAPGRTILSIEMGEGRKRQIRRTLSELGADVIGLIRTAIGPLELGELRSGEHRELTPVELERLRRAAGLGQPITGERPEPG